MKEKKCVICQKVFLSKWNAKTCSEDCKKKHIHALNKKYYQDNKQAIDERNKKNYLKDKDKYQKRFAERRKKIREERLKRGEKIRGYLSHEELSDEEKKSLKNLKKRERYKNDEMFNLAARVRARINTIIRKKEWNKSTSTQEYLGCDLETLKQHLENNFKDGMTWHNRDKWHIDHIVPISSAQNEEEFKLLSNYTNLQPLWSKDNLSKSNKIGIHGVTSSISKKYKGKKEFQQYRYEKIVQYRCAQCGKKKKSKLIVVVNDDWEKIICNGCYGTNLM